MTQLPLENKENHVTQETSPGFAPVMEACGLPKEKGIFGLKKNSIVWTVPDRPVTARAGLRSPAQWGVRGVGHISARRGWVRSHQRMSRREPRHALT